MADEQPGPVMQTLHQTASPPPDGDLADRYLLERFVTAQDQAAFAALVQRHGPMVLGVCRRLLHDAHEAEDAFQATFLVLVHKARSISRPELLGPWLHGVASTPRPEPGRLPGGALANGRRRPCRTTTPRSR